MPAYKTPITVLFRHCDVAGIVFYPRYVEMVNDVIERWLDEALGCSFKEMHLERHAGIPTDARRSAGPARPSRATWVSSA